MLRCVAVSSVAIFLYGELTHGTMHPKMKEAINVLLGALMVICFEFFFSNQTLMIH